MPTNKQYLPKYPIYILSKNRYESRITMNTLDKLGVPYRVVVEPQEYELYAQYLGNDKLLELPFSNHGKGSGPARNWCWEHSIEEGHDRHWIVDDNIYGFYRFHHNRRIKLNSGALFRATEDFVDRYTNVALAGPQYKFFCMDDYPYKPVQLNSRLMSCILIQNDIPHRWRAKYNEDVDLSIRVLKDGYCTMLFYNFLQHKARTGTIKGGNTEELYGGGTYDKSKMLVLLHPDVVQLKKRYGRWHHHVNIKPFQHIKPIRKDGLVLSNKDNEYGMIYVENYDTDEMKISESKPRVIK